MKFISRKELLDEYDLISLNLKNGFYDISKDYYLFFNNLYSGVLINKQELNILPEYILIRDYNFYNKNIFLYERYINNVIYIKNLYRIFIKLHYKEQYYIYIFESVLKILENNTNYDVIISDLLNKNNICYSIIEYIYKNYEVKNCQF